MYTGGSSQVLNLRTVAKLLSNFVFFLLCKYTMLISWYVANFYVICGVIYITCIQYAPCSHTLLLLYAVLSTVLQMAGVGFLVGTLAIFLKDQVLMHYLHIMIGR